MDIPSESNKTKRRKRSNTSPPNPPVQPDNAPSPSPPSPPPPADPAQLEEEECPQCFLTPCVTVREHYWLGEGQPAHPDNHGIRRIKYKSYWKTINNLGGWLDQRYIEKKVAAGGAVHDKRDLMPNCVVNQLRQLYPNPANMQYMGHMWI